MMWVSAESHHSAVFQVTTGATAFFPPGSSVDQQGSVLVCPGVNISVCPFPVGCYWLCSCMSQWLNTLDSKEIYIQVLDHLPELQLLTGDNFEVHFQQISYNWNYIFQNILMSLDLFSRTSSLTTAGWLVLHLETEAPPQTSTRSYKHSSEMTTYRYPFPAGLSVCIFTFFISLLNVYVF